MTTFAEVLMPTAARGHLRPLDIRRDLKQVIDLVELCFQDILDPDGRSFLQEMRFTAQTGQLWGWATTFVEQVANVPYSGFVWEEEGCVVGNLSLIPIETLGRRCYLIANVAVHPDFRGQGIGRMMTEAAVDYIDQRGVASAWLQVRMENAPAVHIYNSLGFLERARRTTWYSRSELPPVQQMAYTFRSRQRNDWPLQLSWLERLYPANLKWHLPCNLSLMRPDFWGIAYRFFSLEYPRHWAVSQADRLLALFSWQQSSGYADVLWLSAPPEPDEKAVNALLLHVRRRLSRHRPLTLDVPADFAASAVEEAGFYPHHTLLWMEKPFR